MREQASAQDVADRAEAARERRVPPWLACAAVAVVGWLVGAHQVGPLSVYAEARALPLVWYLLEQAVSVGATVAALAAAAVLFARSLPPLRAVFQQVCEARWALALAAALASRATLEAFLPREILAAGGDGIQLTLGFGSWVWLALVTVAVAALMLRAAWRYSSVLQLAVGGGARLWAALAVAIVSGEVLARAVIGRAQELLLWPP